MPLGTEVGLGLRDIVFDVHPATPRKRHTHPTQFLAHVYCGQMAGWMKTPLGTEVDLGADHIVLDGVSAPAKGAQQPPLFGPCLLWPRSPISATAELLYGLVTATARTENAGIENTEYRPIQSSLCGQAKLKDRQCCEGNWICINYESKWITVALPFYYITFNAS